MATLVLTAVGTALGGPIGGALGALAGQAVDHRLLRGSPREGPRLNELRVQTSSYGAPIPRLYGTMRVAGTVIWSTDLLESRGVTRAGKGQPGVATYSYRASFAVLLSGRPVHRVGRIWADGQLIRGAAGDWKVRTGFRLHAGGEDQPPDPLIASAEGAQAPAHRGCAYAVFEDLALEAFGNRLPSLTFEVTADEGPVPVGAIAADVASDAVSGGAALAVDGFAATGTTTAVLESLAEASGAWFAPVGAGLTMRDAAAPAMLVAPQRDRPATREVAAADTAPAAVTVSHYDPARDWQAGVQRARRLGPVGATRELEMPAAVSAAVAKGVAAAALRRAAASRVRRTVPATLAALALDPGDAVTLSDEGGAWRIEEVGCERMATTLTLTPLPGATGAVAMAATPGRAQVAPDLPAGATILHAAELPPLDDALLAQPRLVVVANGTGAGWRGAGLLLSLDNGVSWSEAGGTAPPGVVGATETALPVGAETLIDTETALEVRLARADMLLADADAAALDAGANLALVGDELLQFGRAAPLGERRWRLSQLWRGRRGTATGAPVGSRFAMVERDAARTLPLPLSTLGTNVQLMAVGVADGDVPAVVTVAVGGASVLPPAPVALRWMPAADGGATVNWTRRSRTGWRWLDGIDAPLAEEAESYRVTVVAEATRELVVSVPEAVLTPAERTSGAAVTVGQRGTHGESAPVTMLVG